LDGEKGISRQAALTEVSLILAALFWGGNFAATKYAADFLPPLPIVALRFTAGGLLLLLILRLLEPRSRLKRRDLLPMALLGCFGLAGAQTGFTFGLSLTSAANAGLIFATLPVWGMLLGAALGLERPTRRGVLGVGLSILGIGVVVSWPDVAVLPLLVILGVGAIVLPIVVYPISYTVWQAVDLAMRPPEPGDGTPPPR
jgi:drug/metabolite transporter (DMT)-like permease